MNGKIIITTNNNFDLDNLLRGMIIRFALQPAANEISIQSIPEQARIMMDVPLDIYDDVVFFLLHDKLLEISCKKTDIMHQWENYIYCTVEQEGYSGNINYKHIHPDIICPEWRDAGPLVLYTKRGFLSRKTQIPVNQDDIYLPESLATDLVEKILEQPGIIKITVFDKVNASEETYYPPGNEVSCCLVM